MSSLNPTLTVVVIGRNEGERLRRCLTSVRDMNPIGGPVEVIYVDSNSNDGSPGLAATFGAQTIELNAARPSAALARNAGWRAAVAPWILFLDGDTILHPAFPRLALCNAGESSVAAVWGHRREIAPTANFFHRVLDLDWVYAPGLTPFCGGDALFRRAALERVGGFNEILIAGEEPELCFRLRTRGLRILHIDAPMTGHDLAITRWSQYWRRAARAGYAYAQMAWRTRGEQLPLWSAEARGNALRALVLIALVAALPFSPLPATIILAALVVRSAWRSRWKSDDNFSLLCYGAHSHLQQLPIFAGQVAFWWDLVQNRRRGLIEYK
jgi:cellulose synthase/poly-beta-1,6-N-acetylglucosamine synthase-like glycosyltransferase